MGRTLQQRANSDGFPKAGELIEFRPMQELSLQDKRVLNLLIEKAGPRISEDTWHKITMMELRGSAYKSNERISDSLDRLMSVRVEIPVMDENGLPSVRTTVLLPENQRTVDESDPRAIVAYRFTETLRMIVSRSEYWGRIKAHVMFAFSSKHALSLYEALCLRINRNSNEQEISVDVLRNMLGVTAGKYQNYPQLKQSVLTPAIEEINALSDFNVSIEPIRRGGRQRGQLIGFRLWWERKEPEAWQQVMHELARPKVGRKARIRGEVEAAT